MGLPGAGKSTFCERKLAESGLVRINLDTLRTRHRERQLLQECLDKKVSFVVDNTNTLPQERSIYIQAAQQAGYKIEGYFLRSRVQECIDANAKRKNAVPIAAITGMSARLVLPRMDEGFDALYFVSRSNGDFIISPWQESL